MKIWISQDFITKEYSILDNDDFYAVGPIEISNELYEHIHEVRRAHEATQNVLESLVYDWKNPDSPEADCG